MDTNPSALRPSRVPAQEPEMNLPSRTYLIAEGSDRLHRLDIRAWGTGPERRYSISTNHRALPDLHSSDATYGLSASMAEQMLLGLRAVLSGHFDRACTEATLALELAREHRGTNIIDTALPPIRRAPSLENL